MASGDRLGEFHPLDNEDYGSSSLARRGNTYQKWVLEFADADANYAYFRGRMPGNYDGGGISVKIPTIAKTVTSGGVAWEVSIAKTTSNNIDSDHTFTTRVVSSATVSGTNGISVDVQVDISDGVAMDSVTAGDLYIMRIERKATNSNDTIEEAAQIANVITIDEQ